MTARSDPAPAHPATAAAYWHVRQQVSHADSDGFQSRAHAKSPGEVALLYFGSDWTVLADEPVNIPPTLRGTLTTLTYNTILLSNGQAWATANLRTAEESARTGKPASRWENLTGRQRSNQMASVVLNRTICGASPADLFTEIAVAVERSTFGTDPTTWVHAATLLIDTCPAQYRADLDSALFLAALTHPRLVSLLVAAT